MEQHKDDYQGAAEGGRADHGGAWSEANAPVTHRWLDEFSGFADRWEEFRAAWKWAQTSPYLPERRRPSLHGFVDLINTKAKLEHVRGERGLHQSEKGGPVNAGMQILQGDCLAVLRTLAIAIHPNLCHEFPPISSFAITRLLLGSAGRRSAIIES